MNVYTVELLTKLCEESYSYAEVLRKLGLKAAGGNYETLKNHIKSWDIDVSHFTGKAWVKSKNIKFEYHKPGKSESYHLEEIFKRNSEVSQKVLRDYVKRHNVLEYKCVMCGCDGNWNGKQISLELDHIDGDSKNNLLDNLRYLCPNCHATTSTYRGKNKALQKKNKCVETIHCQPKPKGMVKK